MATPDLLPQEPPPPPAPAVAAEPAYESQAKSERRSRLCRYLLVALGVVGFLALLALILWFSLSNNNVDVWVDSASLFAFNLSSSSNATLRYDLSVRFSLQRTSRGLAKLRFDRLLAEAYYNGDYLIHSADLPGFSRRTMRSKRIQVVLAGETPVVLGRGGAELFRQQEKEGRFNIQMRLSWRGTNMLGSLKTKERSYRVRCWLEGLRPDGSQPKGVFGSSWLWSQTCKPY